MAVGCTKMPITYFATIVALFWVLASSASADTVTKDESGAFLGSMALTLIECNGETQIVGDTGRVHGNVMTNLAYQVQDTTGNLHASTSTVLVFEDGLYIRKTDMSGRAAYEGGLPNLYFDTPVDAGGDTFPYGVREAPMKIHLTFQDISQNPAIDAVIEDEFSIYVAKCQVKRD